MDIDLLKELNALRRDRQAAIVVTDTRSGGQTLFQRGDDLSKHALGEEIAQRFLSGKSGTIDGHFVSVYLPSPRLVLIGAVHISQHMVRPAQEAGFDVTVIDPRTAFASEERFPCVPLHAEWPDEILKEAPLDPYTAVAALTHDPKIDDMPLMEALRTGCFYVGALGSRKTHGKRVDRFKAAGITDEQLAAIDAPIGLDIGAASPAEIAIAVLGQIIATLRGRR